jgi:broad specificity phosphatase PhoE
MVMQKKFILAVPNLPPMAIKEIYLIRHGETDYNLAGRVQGSGIDAPLNAKGLAQAKAFFASYMHMNFDRIYVSELIRARQSVEPFIKKGIPVEAHSGLNEIGWGKYEGQQIGRTATGYFDRLFARWRMGETDIPIDGGESPLDVAIRQEPVIDLIFSRTQEKKILICMHGRAMRILLCQLLDLPLRHMETFQHQNLSLYHLRFCSDGSVKCERENCLAHLKEVA